MAFLVPCASFRAVGARPEKYAFSIFFGLLAIWYRRPEELNNYSGLMTSRKIRIQHGICSARMVCAQALAAAISGGAGARRHHCGPARRRIRLATISVIPSPTGTPVKLKARN